MVRSLLSRQGFQVEWAETFEQALERLPHFGPRAILSDLNIDSHLSPDQRFERFRALAPATALVAYSGSPPKDYSEHVDAFFPKDSLNAISLTFVLRKAVQLREEIESLRRSIGESR